MPIVETNGIQTYYEEYGDGPPIVFLHGAFSDHRIWAEQARPLADDYRVIVPDLRGHGRTGGSELDTYTTGLYAEDFHALIEALDLDCPTICGLSMGGMIAQTYAAAHSDTISALVTLGTWTPEVLSREEWFYRRVFQPLFNTLSSVFGHERIGAVMHWINEWRHEKGASGDLEKAERIKQAHTDDYPELAETEGEKIRGTLASFTSMSVDHTSITVPSLFMYGQRELDGPARHANYMANLISEAETREIPNAGHNSHVDNPEFILDSLREFLPVAFDERQRVGR